MDFDDFAPQYIHSKETETKEMVWSLYVAMFPNFDSKSYMTFEQFYNKYVGKKENKNENKVLSSGGKTDEERIAEAEKILFNMEFMEKK